MSRLPITVKPVKSVEIHVEHPDENDLILMYTAKEQLPYVLAPDDWVYSWDVRFRFESEFLPLEVSKFINQVAERQAAYQRRSKGELRDREAWIKVYVAHQLEGRLNIGKNLTLKLPYGAGQTELWRDEVPISKIVPVTRSVARRVVERARRKLR